MTIAAAIALATAAALVFTIALMLLRLFAGPTLYDRLLAANGIIWKCALIAASLGAATGRSEVLDGAFVLMLGLLLANVAVVKFFRARSFQPPLGGLAQEQTP